MSYLDLPRLHFAGDFITRPSTVNNTGRNYKPSDEDPEPAWHKNGDHAWIFDNVTVRSAVDNDGVILTGSADDPVVGASLQSVSEPNAKIVDIDTMQQLSSEVWGLRLQLALPDLKEAFTGNYEAAAFRDLWDASHNRAIYQSVIRDLEWGTSLGSPFLEALQTASSDKRLSIKWIVDLYTHPLNAGKPGFYDQPFYGRVVGTIGPAGEDEPAHFVAGRELLSVAGSSTNYGYARVTDVNTVVFDLGNSLHFDGNGDFRAEILDDGKFITLGHIDASMEAYKRQAGIQSFDLSTLSGDDRERLENAPLVVRNHEGKVPVVALQEGIVEPGEPPSGLHLNTDQRIYRANPDDEITIEIMAYRFGKPCSGLEVTLEHSIRSFRTPQDLEGGVPEDALPLPPPAFTDSNGRVSFTLIVGDPGTPRPSIDGQLYGISYGNNNDWNDPNILVHSRYPSVANPVWTDVESILSQYARLYPYMTGIIDLSSHQAIKNNLAGIIHFMEDLSMTDPDFMPVTRDLSRDKTDLILRWLHAGAP